MFQKLVLWFLFYYKSATRRLWKTLFLRLNSKLYYMLVNTMNAFHCVETLKMAVDSYGKPEIFNSDQGSQFTSSEFVTELRAHGIQISMDGRGQYLDNGKMKRFWGHWNMRTSKSRSMSACRSSVSVFSIMWIFITQGGFIRHSNIGCRMKSIS